jgi:large subunit ribosomal protein L10
MPNDKNKQEVASLREKISKSKSIIFADYIGLNSNDVNSLRATMRVADAEVAVAKNTLMKIALNEENIDTSELEKDLKGNTAVIFSYGDAVKPIKSLFDFIKKVELPKVKAGIFEGKYSNAADVELISKLPSKEQLIAQFIGGLKSPLSGVVGVFGGVQRKFVYAVKAIADKK